MPPVLKKTSTKKAETAQYLFYKDRLATYKNFEFDKVEGATCTSDSLAKAGFFCTGPDSAKCPFCLKDLFFDADDDPWKEHQKRQTDCEFVRIGKTDESTLTLADAIVLSQIAIAMAKFEEHNKIFEELNNRMTTDVLVEQLSKLTATSTTRSTARRAK